MCITFFSLTPGNQIKFLLAFNRDEDADRPTLPFHQFDTDSNIYGGKDQLSGGTWFGINIKTGIMVILTNYRKYQLRKGVSRGLLVKHFLSTNYAGQNQSTSSVKLTNKIYEDLKQILEKPKGYSPFNLCVFNIRDNKIFYICSEALMKQPYELSINQIHGLSNTTIFNKWEKVERGKKLFGQVVENLVLSEVSNKQEIFTKLQEVMKNKEGCNWISKHFQSSIFIPFYRYLFYRKRMTKSTCYIAIEEIDGQNTIYVKEVSYNQDGSEKEVKHTLKMKQVSLIE